jgi:hypothetical protein
LGGGTAPGGGAVRGDGSFFFSKVGSTVGTVEFFLEVEVDGWGWDPL